MRPARRHGLRQEHARNRPAPELGAAKSAAYVEIEWYADKVAKPFGDLFLRLLFMVVVPIVFSSLFLGVAGLGL